MYCTCSYPLEFSQTNQILILTQSRPSIPTGYKHASVDSVLCLHTHNTKQLLCMTNLANLNVLYETIT